MPSILITGADGFVGSYLLPALVDSFDGNVTITATYLLNEPKHIQGITWHQLDISKREDVFSLVANVKPDRVIHLAAISHVPTADSAVELTWQVNVLGSVYLFDAIKKHVPLCSILYISSSEVYGKSFQEHNKITETACLQPMNVYATSKAAVDMLCANYVAQGLKILRLRPFNHIGPGQAENFVISAFSSQIAAIEKHEQQPIIKVGNLSVVRDFLDVRDVVSAYITILKKIDDIESGEVINIASSNGYKIGDLLEILLSFSSINISVEVDEARLRPVEIESAIGSYEKINRIMGWLPKYKIDETLKAVIEEWRCK